MGIWLVMKTANGGERPFRVSEHMTIGRETRCHVRIAVPSVANRHCELTVDQRGVVRLADLGSDKGTYHNGSRVREAVLNHADTVQIGPVIFEVRVDQSELMSDSTLEEEAAPSVEVRVTQTRVEEGPRSDARQRL